MDKKSEMYWITKTVTNLRKSEKLWEKKQVQRYADNNFYAFTRDNILALFTNTNDYLTRTITYHSYPEGTKLCNAFNMSECIYVKNNQINITIKGDPKVYIVTK
jgi:alpha-amylase